MHGGVASLPPVAELLDRQDKTRQNKNKLDLIAKLVSYSGGWVCLTSSRPCLVTSEDFSVEILEA